ncbi:MAG: family 16 glycosylhydrolase [Gammaproteobacteria bacterium]|nr:family 16 glycosylhydrolase [Gammaproteobacteria bacterium]
MRKSIVTLAIAIQALYVPVSMATDITRPYIIEQDARIVTDYKWQLVSELSDEFEGNQLSIKWDTRNVIPGKFHWNGRFPGLFKPENVSVIDGELRMEGKKEDTYFENRLWTHSGAILRSHALVKPGMYTEAKMKTTTTIMSGTFWMQSPWADTCPEFPRTELDVTESIGRAASAYKPTKAGETQPEWYSKAKRDFLQGMNATARQRTDKCTAKQINVETPQGKGGDFIPSEDFHVYGFHWRTSTKLDFYVDGRFSHTIIPSVPFTTPMSIILAIEIYDFNWPSDVEKDGFNESPIDRSTRYKWIRTWQNNN